MKINIGGIKLNSYFLTFVFAFAYIQSLQIRIQNDRVLNIYTFTPEAAFGTFLNSCLLFIIIGFLLNWQKHKSKDFDLLHAVQIFGLSLLIYLFVNNLLALLIAWIFGNIERNFTWDILLINNINNLLDVFIYGSFFLAFSFYQRNKFNSEQLANYNKALAESRIDQLKAQLNPHFLFNNLNILDQLIEEDSAQASEFLNEFAELYRYVLQSSDKPLVPLEEELLFAKSYFKIMQQKYGDCYTLEVDKQKINGYIPPLTLQLLLENAFDHNIGAVTQPVEIKISIGKKIVVSNNLIKKEFAKKTGGRALHNLKEQYRLLSNEEIEINEQGNRFSVVLPLILSHK